MAEFNAGFKVYADSTAFEKGMAGAVRTAEHAGKGIARALDGKAIATAIFSAVGFSLSKIIEQSSEAIARWITGFSKDNEEALKKTVEETGKAAEQAEKNLDKAREEYAKKEQQRSDQRLKEWQMLTDFKNKANEEDAKKAEELQDSQDEAKDKFVEMVEEAKKKNKELAETQKDITHEVEKTTTAEEEYLAWVKKITEEKNKQASIAGVRGVSQFGQASTGALNEALRRDQGAIQGMGPFLNIGQQMEVARLQAEISNIKQELNFRDELQRNISVLGAEGARSAFKGDPLAYDRLVQQYVQDSRDAQKIAADSYELLRQMNERQKSGLPVVNLNL